MNIYLNDNRIRITIPCICISSCIRCLSQQNKSIIITDKLKSSNRPCNNPFGLNVHDDWVALASFTTGRSKGTRREKEITGAWWTLNFFYREEESYLSLIYFVKLNVTNRTRFRRERKLFLGNSVCATFLL